MQILSVRNDHLFVLTRKIHCIVLVFILQLFTAYHPYNSTFVVLLKNIAEMFVVAFILASFLGSRLLSFDDRIDFFVPDVLHRMNALFLQIFLNFSIVDAVHCHRPPQFLKIFIHRQLHRFVVVKQHDL